MEEGKEKKKARKIEESKENRNYPAKKTILVGVAEPHKRFELHTQTWKMRNFSSFFFFIYSDHIL